jgi:hypothetical protein
MKQNKLAAVSKKKYFIFVSIFLPFRFTCVAAFTLPCKTVTDTHYTITFVTIGVPVCDEWVLLFDFLVFFAISNVTCLRVEVSHFVSHNPHLIHT